MLPFQTENLKNGSLAIFLNPFTVCYLFEWKFVVSPFVDGETNGNCSFENGLNGLNRANGLAHLCM
jgi:hypothetical protein